MAAIHQKAGLLHNLLESPGGRDMQELGRRVSNVLISVGNVPRKEHKRARTGPKHLIAALDLILSFQNVHGLVFAMVNMQWKTGVRVSSASEKAPPVSSAVALYVIAEPKTLN
jgi:hypothetical protein